MRVEKYRESGGARRSEARKSINLHKFNRRLNQSLKPPDVSSASEVLSVSASCQCFPRYFATSVEANLMDAAALLRETVSSVTAELGAKDFEADDIVQEIQVIPQKVRKVADEAISRAVNASVEELHQQLDEALGVLSSRRDSTELLRPLDQLPVVAEKRITAGACAVAAVVDSAEDKIVDLVADLKSEFVPNHWLMEALLRAKASPGCDPSPQAKENVEGSREVCQGPTKDPENAERSQSDKDEIPTHGKLDQTFDHEVDIQVRNPGSSSEARCRMTFKN
eukprot:Skav232782  [mRNA]  locus=scaffold614:167599:168441:- [translate_table: standard]